MEPDMHFRLAELYMRSSKTDRFFEVHRESETIVKLAPRSLKKLRAARRLQKAVDTYGMIQKKFPDFCANGCGDL